VYFLGIGGIGMSALARYFHAQDVCVSGYDRTKTALTEALQNIGMDISYEDDLRAVPENIDLVVYTPAIPENLGLYKHFSNSRLPFKKRAEVLGLISNSHFNIAIAGTHGKTSISTLTAHIFHEANKRCHAFVGGISKNYNSNWLRGNEDIAVVEADEFDASFLHLSPNIASVSTMDPDHLDIYGAADKLKIAFEKFVANLRPGGMLFKHVSCSLEGPESTYTYGVEEGDYRAENVHFNFDKNHRPQYSFDLNFKGDLLQDMRFHIAGMHNVENAVVASAIAYSQGISQGDIKKALGNYQGIKRRFEYHCTNKPVYIDDYAHHPTEIKAALNAVKSLYPKAKITGVFQPHLYTRTRDFLDGFVEALSNLDHLILLDIYPARELPIEGVTSKLIYDEVKTPRKDLLSLEELVPFLDRQKDDLEVLISMGAGNIDKKVDLIKQLLTNEG